jgi:hypothetical protein
MKTSLSAGYCTLFKVQVYQMQECKGCKISTWLLALMPSTVNTSQRLAGGNGGNMYTP